MATWARDSLLAVFGDPLPVGEILAWLGETYPGVQMLDEGAASQPGSSPRPARVLVPEPHHSDRPLSVRLPLSGEFVSFDAYVPDAAVDLVARLLHRYCPAAGQWIWVGFGHDGAALPLDADMTVENLLAALENPPPIDQLQPPPQM